MTMITMYSTSTCPRCERVARLFDENDIAYKKRVIDIDPEAEADAIMFDIYSAPALESGGNVLLVDEMFDDDDMNAGTILSFARSSGS